MTGWRAYGMLAFHPYRWNRREVGCRETIYSFSRLRHNPTTLLQLTSQTKLTLTLNPNPKC